MAHQYQQQDQDLLRDKHPNSRWRDHVFFFSLFKYKTVLYYEILTFNDLKIEEL